MKKQKGRVSAEELEGKEQKGKSRKEGEEGKEQEVRTWRGRRRMGKGTRYEELEGRTRGGKNIRKRAGRVGSVEEE